MKFRFREFLHLEFYLIGIQLLFSAAIVFFHASGKQFPFSLILFLNSGLYIALYGKRLRFIKSAIGLVLFLLALTVTVSYSNYLNYPKPSGFMFHEASLLELITFSLVWALNFFVFYIYALGKSKMKILVFFSWAFLLVSIYANIRAYNYRALLETEKQYHYYYYLITIIPLLVWSTKNGKIKYALIFIALIATVFSFKRTGIFVIAVLILINIFYDFRASSWKGNVAIILLLTTLATTGYFFSPQMEGQITLMLTRLDRIQTDGGSGRLDQAFSVYKEFPKQSIENKIIGNGFWSMYLKEKHFIDVEWASMLYYFGLFGLFFYTLFHIFMLLRLRFLLRINHAIAISFLNCYAIFLLYSVASELFTYQYLSVPLFIYLGMMEGLVSKKIEIKYDEESII